MINIVDGKEVDFTPYMLKSLETVEMGLPCVFRLSVNTNSGQEETRILEE